MELSPVGFCNHRCIFCGLDFMGYQNRKLDIEMLRKRVPELGKVGVKSIMYAGEGEPFLHKDFSEIVDLTVKNNIDVAITTNGVLLKKELSENILGKTKWIKVSINAGAAKTYSKIHATQEKDFDIVIENLANAVKIKKQNNYYCTLGMQIILLPENRNEIEQLAEIAKEIGMDYLVVKPYSQHTQSDTKIYENIKYKEDLHLAESLKKYNSSDFSVIFRLNTMKKWDNSEREYDSCSALPFWSYIDAGGNVWGCSMFLGDKRFLYGNVNKNSFEEIWSSEKRKEALEIFENKFDISTCRINCRMDEVNKYLWELKNPNEHVNFI